MGGRSVGDPPNVLAHKVNQLRVFEVRDEKLALNPHDLLLANERVSTTLNPVRNLDIALTWR